MDQTFRALGALFTRAIPTFLLVILLHFYLKKMFFGPLARALKARDEATAGARRQAEAALAHAAERATEYENALRAARGEVAQEQEALRSQWREREASAIAEAKHSAAAAVKEAQAGIAAEVATARQLLAKESEALAEQIAGAICERKAG
jgi:F-type H+-transporting ATPase subunit b